MIHVISKIPIQDTNLLKPIVKDYLNQDPFLNDFCSGFPRMESIDHLIKQGFVRKTNRASLMNALRNQYEACGINDSLIQRQIDSLLSEDTFTVCTGQQPGIFLGPLYTTYKILSAIHLSEALKQRFPSKNFIPVFYMATEDHDFEEIKNTLVNGKKYTWDASLKGPMGRYGTEQLLPLVNELRQQFSGDNRIDQLIEIFDHAYHLDNLSKATRYIIHKIFGHLGLLVIDPDDKSLKENFKQVIIDDLKNNITSNELAKTLSRQLIKYKPQVKGREVNYFYLRDNYRERILLSEAGYSTADKQYQWKEEELFDEINQNPERFSPNVVTRPLYQETILPNILYLGGGAEVAYWLQLKSCFDNFDIPFPLLFLRKSIIFLDAHHAKKIADLGLDTSDLFLPKEQSISQWIDRHFKEEIDLSELKNRLKKFEESITEISSSVSPPKAISAKAMVKKWENELIDFENKLIREKKKIEKDKVDKIDRIFEFIFPGGQFQERAESMVLLFLSKGDNVMDELLSLADPTDNNLLLIS